MRARLRIFLFDHRATFLGLWRFRGVVIAHHSQRRRLWQQRKLPDKTWRIWIANYEGADPGTLWASYPFRLNDRNRSPRREANALTFYNSQVASYVIGKLFILIVRSPHQFFVRRLTYPPIAGHLRQIWPALTYIYASGAVIAITLIIWSFAPS